ncbi:dipeptide ABC transporter ATP-binding protein [Tatumella citrea]|uniref:ABC transporter ATP-binding protein n=1 Tax=Tatumella citrea TaxID=53336 RepID=A0A1Y0LDZ2_TATCI|nr:ABC transporter ATP-binding protein [Tatumella citrea]ARU96005.1 ABC transporter ATP-binding protein [Tatumella citrea]ARV00043.1 ABC transporter ATP-binding protein [Tatumella citrea]
MPVLQLDALTLAYHSDDQWRETVHQVSFSLNAGEMLAVVGESGSGKTTTAQAVMGLLPENGRRSSGRILFNGEDISQWSSRRLDSLRGAQISLVPQDPGNSLNPLKTLGEQVGEVLLLKGPRLSRAQRRTQVTELFRRVGLSHPEQRIFQYPHQLSGGMKQRVLIAIAIAMKPALIIADEPTSALDVTVQKLIMNLIDELRHEYGTAVLFVTHSLALASEHADRLVVFREGRLLEQGPTEQVIRHPQHAYTQQLLASVRENYAPAGTLPVTVADSSPVIRISSVAKQFSLSRKQQMQALQDISLTVSRGTTHALVGESGSGKTTLARILLGFEQADAGDIEISGQSTPGLSREGWRQLRQKIQFVYQNPFSSLDPHQTLFTIIEEPLLNFTSLTRAQRQQRVEEVAGQVALDPALLLRRAQQLSGGQRQRVAIARALILRPEILVLDEATSALDVTVQSQILALLSELQKKLSLTYLFITHDLQVVRRIAHHVSVLRGGRLIEQGETAQLFAAPQDDYTRQLINAIPAFNPSVETVV